MSKSFDSLVEAQNTMDKIDDIENIIKASQEQIYDLWGILWGNISKEKDITVKLQMLDMYIDYESTKNPNINISQCSSTYAKNMINKLLSNFNDEFIEKFINSLNPLPKYSDSYRCPRAKIYILEELVLDFELDEDSDSDDEEFNPWSGHIKFGNNLECVNDIIEKYYPIIDIPKENLQIYFNFMLKQWDKVGNMDYFIRKN